MTDVSLWSIFLNAALVNNFVLAYFLGICPFFGVSSKLETAARMGAAVGFVMLVASVCAFLINLLLDAELLRSKWQAHLYKTEPQPQPKTNDEHATTPERHVNLLVEVVSATNLPPPDNGNGSGSTRNPLVVVHMGAGTELHRTRALPKTLDPI